jgi:peptidoglycan hydrolase-like protein with peptidoglycan-binding domain
MPPIYASVGLREGVNDAANVKALQRDLRALGYLHHGIDGGFGGLSTAAVRALQFDLLYNEGLGSDGNAPVAVANYNKGRVAAVTGVVDANTAACIGDMLDDPAFPKVPKAANPPTENKQATDAIAAASSKTAPTPFLLAMFKQESGGRHYREPAGIDEDSFVVIGLDRSTGVKDHITSRGYGIGQYTIFHHPPAQAEIDDFILDPVQNVAKAFEEFRNKFDHFVLGANGADDRKAENPLLPLRLCKYAASDPKYMQDCRACAKAAPRVNLSAGSRLYPGSTDTLQPTQYYASANYPDLPDRSALGCDWPYAARRYNGGGVNSYHYQARILKNLATMA